MARCAKYAQLDPLWNEKYQVSGGALYTYYSLPKFRKGKKKISVNHFSKKKKKKISRELIFINFVNSEFSNTFCRN